MRIRNILICLPLLAACTAETIPTGEIVGTTATIVDGFSKSTKTAVSANAYKETVPSSTNKLEADIWFSTDKGIYKGNTCGETEVDDKNKKVDAHRTITYMGPSITNSDITGKQAAIRYYEGTTLYCVGLYPQKSWTVSGDGDKATATVNGSDDLMFAPQISGSQTNPLSKTAQMFSHKLCWVKIRVRSQDLTSGETWGNLQKIEIKTKPTATVTLDDGSIEFSGDDTYITVFDGNETMPIMSTEKGSVLVAPVTTSVYTVKVTCGNHWKEATVTLQDDEGKTYSKSTAGKVFILTLSFKALQSIEVTSTLSEWDEEVRNLTLKPQS